MTNIRSSLRVAVCLGALACVVMPPASAIKIGDASTELADCFEDSELLLNALLREAVPPGPSEPYELTLLDIQRTGARRAANRLRSGVRGAIRFGEPVDMNNVRRLDFLSENSLILAECEVTLAMMEDPAVGDEDKKRRGRSLAASVKHVLVLALESTDGTFSDALVPLLGVVNKIVGSSQ